MKNLKFYDKVFFSLNSLVAFLLLLAYILPKIPPKTFSVLSVLALGVPVLLLLNILFFFYWLFKLKKQLLLPLLVLVIGFNYLTSIYKFTGSKSVNDDSNFSIMTYNVRLFNKFNWLPEETIDKDIKAFVQKENPTIISLQEYQPNDNFKLNNFYEHTYVTGNKVKSGQAIFSKYPILNSGVIKFPKSSNSAIYVDVKHANDTIRIYNLHLQSSKLSPKVSDLQKESSEALTRRIGEVFKIQQTQAELILKHQQLSPYKTIVTGDFNNTAYSYVYKLIKGELKDTFEYAGNGFGRTFNFNIVPLRIDFILADASFEINGFKNFDVKYSDHYPIKAILK